MYMHKDDSFIWHVSKLENAQIHQVNGFRNRDIFVQLILSLAIKRNYFYTKINAYFKITILSDRLQNPQIHLYVSIYTNSIKYKLILREEEDGVIFAQKLASVVLLFPPKF